ncbi:MAG: fluoride efflux transporter CrcB [Alphaproteobacteria bacterium]
MKMLLAIALGGAIGAVSRYGVVVAAGRWFGFGFPWGTLAVNIVGSLVIGLMFQMLEHRFPGIDPAWRGLIVVGFLGALTTYSSFALDAADLFLRGEIAAVSIYISATLIGALTGVASGLAIGKMLWA